MHVQNPGEVLCYSRASQAQPQLPREWEEPAAPRPRTHARDEYVLSSLRSSPLRSICTGEPRGLETMLSLDRIPRWYTRPRGRDAPSGIRNNIHREHTSFSPHRKHLRRARPIVDGIYRRAGRLFFFSFSLMLTEVFLIFTTFQAVPVRY